MSIEKIKVVDKVEVIENGCIQIRSVERIIEDGVVIAESFHRHTICPGDDYSKEDNKVIAIASAIWTPEVISSYKALLTN
jgi:hypothetical protein